jgi:hypothetical protein
VWVFCVWAITNLPAGRVSAQVGAEVALMRDTSDGVPSDLAATLDAELLKALAEVAAIRSPFVSPVNYSEIQLTVGCSDESVSCLTAIAQTAEAPAIIVRQLVADESGIVRVRLLYFAQSPGGPPSQAEISASHDHQARLTDGIAAAVRRLFAVAESPGRVDDTSPRSIDPHAALAASHGEPTLTPLTWITLGAGAALLVPGIVLGLSADADYDEFRRTPVSTRADADRARRDFSSIETRATWSSVLIPAGALALGVGGVLLGIDLAADDGREQSGQTQLFVAPLGRGGVLGLRGSLDGTP